jgi:hypothetical protein
MTRTLRESGLCGAKLRNLGSELDRLRHSF